MEHVVIVVYGQSSYWSADAIGQMTSLEGYRPFRV